MTIARLLEAYVVRPEDLRLQQGSCPMCGGPKPFLVPLVPPGMQGDNRPSPRYDLVTDFTRWIRPHADAIGCGRCQVVQAIARLFPAQWMPIEGPAEAELRQIREEMARQSKPAPEPHGKGSRRSATPAPEPEFPGQLFDLGNTRVTKAAAMALGRTLASCTDVAGPHVEPTGMARAPSLLARHVTGEAGILGRLEDGDPDRGAKLGPVAGVLDRNAAAIRAGQGTVRSSYRLERRAAVTTYTALGPITTPERVVDTAEITIRSELGSGPLTLVFDPHVDGPIE